MVAPTYRKQWPIYAKQWDEMERTRMTAEREVATKILDMSLIPRLPWAAQPVTGRLTLRHPVEAGRVCRSFEISKERPRRSEAIFA
jgi:hypothetical protein